ncbi:hypothetical protein CXF89_12355 [Pseudoalteromonas sp. MelDa3]|jgi:hypothetical protein|nr:hypothetical protein CXF89_12355 [Pseudoalteromonas sp. MelDa3]
MGTAMTKGLYLANQCTYGRARTCVRLCRYITRSGISEKRLAITTYGKVLYQLKSALHQLQRHHPNLLKLRLIAPESL